MWEDEFHSLGINLWSQLSNVIHDYYLGREKLDPVEPCSRSWNDENSVMIFRSI